MMSYQFNISAILAVALFVIPVLYKIYYKLVVDLSDLVKITLAAMALPDLIICLFHLITNPSKAVEMAEVTQYLTIAVLVIIFLSIQEIKQIFRRKSPE